MLLLHFFHYFYVPSTGPWYTGNIWGNVFVAPVVVVLAFVWSKTKFWPLRPIQHGLDSLHRKHDAHALKLDAMAVRLEELHDKHDALTAALTGDPPAAPS